MILKALYDYYNRSGENIAPMNMAYVTFSFAIWIDSDGNYSDYIEQLGEDGIPLLTVRPEERTSSPIPHCMGDNGSYVLGLKDVKNIMKVEDEFKKNSNNYNAFKQSVEKTYNNCPNNEYAKAIYLFYQKYDASVRQRIVTNSNWQILSKNLQRNITFRIKGCLSLAASDHELLNNRIAEHNNSNKECICLISGKKARPVETTYSSFILGSKSNAKLVSFQVSSGYDSYGKSKGLNAPISEEAEFKYTTALLKLISKESHNKFIIGNRTFLFWATSNNVVCQSAESSLYNLLGFSEAGKDDDPNSRVEKVRKVFTSIYSGALHTTSDEKFYILGLAPNAARIAVIFWAEIDLKKFAGMILHHFEDMEIIDNRKDKRSYFGIREMLSAVSLGGKQSDAAPNLTDSIAKSIFNDIPYPYTLLSACIRRIKAEISGENNPIWISRAGIIKAYLNRINDNNQKMQIMLDKQNNNPGYLCGRLFAVLDDIQYAANKQTSIRSSYMSSASSTPSVVFGKIMSLSNAHIKKIANEKPGLAHFFEEMKKDIFNSISADGFPANLSLEDQGRFFVGYYHQKNYKEEKEAIE